MIFPTQDSKTFFCIKSRYLEEDSKIVQHDEQSNNGCYKIVISYVQRLIENIPSRCPYRMVLQSFDQGFALFILANTKHKTRISV